MIKNKITVLAFVIISINVYSQCTVTAYANAETNSVGVCLGDSVILNATANCTNYFLNNNFNNGTPGTGWSATNQAMFTNPCQPNSPDGTIYFWMGSTSPAPRNLTTVNFDVSQGGTIQFEMRYSIQADNSPCEGPDEYQEGIAIQYSLNSGATWNTIEYYAPNGDVLSFIPTSTTPGATGNTPFTVWTTRTVPIPVAAQTTSTMFRWAQTSSTSEIYDHWGLDNVRIIKPVTPVFVWWSHGAFGTNPPVLQPTTDTTYTVYLTDSTDTVQSSVNVFVHPIPTSAFTATSPVNLGTFCTVTYTGNASANATYSWGFDGGIFSGSGQGPYLVTFPGIGNYNINLGVLENGCLSLITVVPVLVNQA